MADKTFIQSVFLDPPIAVARLGGSPAPLDAYEWAQPRNPRTEGETVVVPAWSLNVSPDGSVEPIMPVEIQFRDGDQIRPVCPFFEVWALVSERPGDPPGDWTEAPLTTGLLQANGVTDRAVRIRIDAKNRKAARRADATRLVFGTFPAVSVRADRHTSVLLRGVNAPNIPAAQRMIPPNRSIPLGSVQVMRPAVQPATPTAWSEAGVRLDVIRFRFTPARGQFYGPPAAARTTRPAVAAGTHDFLRARAGWWGSPRDARPRPLRVVDPEDTIDERRLRSLGVVDDTCEGRIDVVLTLRGRNALSAHATVFVAPPDFAPDRRPFLSVADELNDRIGDPAARTAGMKLPARDLWVEDLFERISETVALLNVDYYRLASGIQRLRGDRLRPAPGIAGDGLPGATRAMGARDKLRNAGLEPVPQADAERPLPLSARARERHGYLSEINSLRDFVGQNAGRLRELVRGPFEIEAIEDGSDAQTMRMPPFMRNSNGNPLTLSAWQYALLMEWASQEETRAVPLAPGGPRARRPLSPFAAERRAAALARLRRGPEP